jgi:hypothetical protein
MEVPVITAEAPPVRARSLAQQEGDFTAEGSPPPGVVGSAESPASQDKVPKPHGAQVVARKAAAAPKAAVPAVLPHARAPGLPR